MIWYVVGSRPVAGKDELGEGIDAPQKKARGYPSLERIWLCFGKDEEEDGGGVDVARMEILYSGGRGEDGGTQYRRSRRSMLIARWREKEKGRRFLVSDGAALLLSEVDDVVVR